jgi:hypothetical protein
VTTETALHAQPPFRAVLREQLRHVGLLVRAPGVTALALIAVVSLLIALEYGEGARGISFHPEHQMLPGILGLLFPLAVWRGVERAGPGFFWTLPVDRSRHALSRVLAGWAWLMAALAVFVLWLLALALVTGGEVLTAETIRLVPAAFPVLGELEAGAGRPHLARPQPLYLLVPFTAATVTYLISSALLVGVRHPLRWIGGAVLALAVVVFLFQLSPSDEVRLAPARALRAFLDGPYGTDAVLTARTESFKILARHPEGGTAVVWRGLPGVGEWVAATLLWSAGALAALAAALFRQRERRR